ncbi:MAG: hypothetical protein KatS3mg057_3253 [Herpetosiphonaceae bacterium]|nr:MAG: hypothetical protein KatS3mg057_3253 [Herpetosiphonaceae bacterium]
MQQRSLIPRMAVALLALLGFFESLFLTLSRYQQQTALVCPFGGGCTTVQTSRWSSIPPGEGIPVALVGVGGYAILVGIALLSLHHSRVGAIALPPAMVAIASAGVLFACYLTVLQVFVIRALCSWCLGSALIMLGIWGAALRDWQAWRQVKAPRRQRGGAS